MSLQWVYQHLPAPPNTPHTWIPPYSLHFLMIMSQVWDLSRLWWTCSSNPVSGYPPHQFAADFLLSLSCEQIFNSDIVLRALWPTSGSTRATSELSMSWFLLRNTGSLSLGSTVTDWFRKCCLFLQCLNPVFNHLLSQWSQHLWSPKEMLSCIIQNLFF